MKNLAISYRAKVFEDVVGQDTTIKGIKAKLKDNNLANVILLKGSTGTGKTTTALLIAMSLNCTNRKEDGNPCGECQSCKSILTQNFYRDVILFDGSTFSTKEDVINLFNLLDSSPMFDKNKIFIIEEADQLSDSAKNSFLKIFERNLKNVYFILLSMKINGIPDAIKSRCQVYNFYPISISNCMLFIKSLMEKLKIWDSKEIPDSFRTEGLATIASLSRGSLREAIQIFERCITEKIFDKNEIEKMVFSETESSAQAVLAKVIKKDNTFVQDIIEQENFISFFNLFFTLVQKIIVYQKTGFSASTSDYFNKILQSFFPYVTELSQIELICRDIQKSNFVYNSSAQYNLALRLLEIVERPIKLR